MSNNPRNKTVVVFAEDSINTLCIIGRHLSKGEALAYLIENNQIESNMCIVNHSYVYAKRINGEECFERFGESDGAGYLWKHECDVSTGFTRKSTLIELCEVDN